METPREEFSKRVDAALNNETLQTALDNNAFRRKHARSSSLETLPHDLETYREDARNIREEVINNLDQYLDTFVNQAKHKGLVVHFANTGEDASSIVEEIARGHQAELLVKAKSMVTEEIHLNRRLEKNGFKVVESDLGEYIVQLRGETPSHIITPAVHLRRQDVARLFNEKFGMPLTDDIRIMTDIARKELRDVFLNADIGISGVNFAVAETGTLCILSNEGNGRMVTTLPRIHIALLGIERLVPTLNDLIVMLDLLPRHATGQKITSYVNFIQSPRLQDDQDGPQERHLILVDNRRKLIANSSMKEMLLCIRCGACLNACPVFQEIGGHAYNSPYPGPIGSILSPQLFGIPEYGHLAKASTLCGACVDACPVKIDFPSLLLETRHEYEQKVPQPWLFDFVMQVFSHTAKRPGLYAFALRSIGIFSSMISSEENWFKTLPAPFNRWTKSRHFPKPARQPFRNQWKNLSPSKDVSAHLNLPQSKKSVSPQNLSRLPEVEPSVLINRFANELHSLGSEFIQCDTNNIQTKLLDILKQSNAQKLLIWDDLEITPEFNMGSWLKSEGFTTLSTRLLLRDPARKGGISWLSKADTGVTGAIAAIADTGSLVLASGRDYSQLASLLPDHHIVVLQLDRIFPDLQSWFRAGGSELITTSQCVTLVTGPSRTADIEMSLTIGVHGPAKVTVLGLDPSTIRVSSPKIK